MKTKVLSREKISETQLPKEALVDRAFTLNAEIKEKEKELDKLKVQLKAQAEMQQTHEIHGVYATASITDTSSWSIDPDKMIEWLKKNKKNDLIPILLRPSVSDVVKYLGEITIREFGELDTKEYNKIMFKPRR